MSSNDDIAMGGFAEQLLANPAYKEAFKRVKENLFDEFSKTGVFGKRKREAIHKKVQVVDAIQNEIEMMVSKGKFLQQEEARMERNKKLKGL